MTRGRRAVLALVLATLAASGVAVGVLGLIALIDEQWRIGLALMLAAVSLVALPMRAVHWINARHERG